MDAVIVMNSFNIYDFHIGQDDVNGKTYFLRKSRMTCDVELVG